MTVLNDAMRSTCQSQVTTQLQQSIQRVYNVHEVKKAGLDQDLGSKSYDFSSL